MAVRDQLCKSTTPKVVSTLFQVEQNEHRALGDFVFVWIYILVLVRCNEIASDLMQFR